MRPLGSAQSLEGGNLIFTHVPKRRQTCPRKLFADDGSAGTALPETAAELRTIQSEIVPQHIEERSIGPGVHQSRFPVDNNSMWHLSPAKLEAV